MGREGRKVVGWMLFYWGCVERERKGLGEKEGRGGKGWEGEERGGVR